ncbi:MAG TPA: alpha/beta hydrolase [Xanthobacteraceae bacterium]|jgi:pimeloyl-ACP methyl ester carboxylesterase|nr:alpha/beta hydrolase [Xanthobacteraceae bacterium]
MTADNHPLTTKGIMSRRTIIQGSALLGAASTLADGAPAHGAANASDPLVPVPLPAQVSAKEAFAQLPGTRLGYWDTGGDGTPIVLLHPATGSALIWGYQQPVFARGYRVISYSRRGHHNSEPVPRENPGSASQDLHNLIEFLNISKFHAVGSAAGCSVAVDYAHSHPERLSSMVLACGLSGVTDAEYVTASESLRPKGFAEMPADFRELSPSYRVANPQGAAQWLALEHKAVTGNRVGQRPANKITLASLEKMQVPTLLIAGDADLWQPPAMTRMLARHIPNSELVVVPEAGHSIYWERPDLFNSAVLDFIGRHSK